MTHFCWFCSSNFLFFHLRRMASTANGVTKFRIGSKHLKNVMCDVTLWTLFFHGVGNLISKNVKQVEVEILFLLKKYKIIFVVVGRKDSRIQVKCVCVFGMKIGRHTKYTQGSCWSFQSVKHKETFLSLRVLFLSHGCCVSSW